MRSRMLSFLTLGFAATFPLALRAQEAQQEKPVAEIEQAPVQTETSPVPLGYESDIYCFGYVAEPRQKFLASISGAESVSEQEDFVSGDIVYLDRGNDAGIKAGDDFWVVVPGEEVNHPITGKPLGEFYSYHGRIRILCAQDRAAIAQVIQSCTGIPMWAGVIPFEPIPIPLERRTLPKTICDLPNGKKTGTIVYTRDGVVVFSADYDVIVDLGSQDGLAPGDFLTIYRYEAGLQGPRTILGEGAVLTVADHTSTVRVLDASHVLYRGDSVEIK